MNRTIILAASLLANGILIAGYVAKRGAGKSEPTRVETTQAAPQQSDRVRRGARVASNSSETVTNDFRWTSLESEEYREYIENLRAIGCPEETIRDIIIADVNKLYAGRIKALYPAPADFKFWVTEDRSRTTERQRDQQIRALDREKRALIKELLGVDLEDEMSRWSGRPSDDEMRYGFLSAEKQEQLRSLQNKYRDLERSLFAEGGGMNAENRAKLNALRAQREAEMAQMLTPQEYEEYQLRTSWTARNMRENLAGFEPTEWEFRELFKARKSFDDQFRFNREGSDQTTREQRETAEQSLAQQLRSVLGEDRYAQYERANDDRYREAYEFAQRANLPQHTADSLYDIRRVAETERQRVLNDPNIPAEKRPEILQALADETKRTLSTTLGANYEDYARRDPWLNRLGQVNNRRGGPERGGGGGDFGPPRERFRDGGGGGRRDRRG